MTPLAKMRPNMAKMRPKIAKMRLKMAKMRIKMAKMRLKMAMDNIFDRFSVPPHSFAQLECGIWRKLK